MTNEKRVTIELVRENGEVKEFMAGVLPAVAKQILRTTSPSNGGRLRIVEPTATPVEGVTAAQVGVERRAASVAAMVKVGVDQPHDHARLASDIAALDALHGAPLVTTRRMAVATLCDDIEHAEGLTAANQVVLDTLVSEGRALPHHHARLAFDNAAIDIMYQQHATLLGRSLDDRA